MDKALHGLLGIPVGLLVGTDGSTGKELVDLLAVNAILFPKTLAYSGQVGIAAFQLGHFAGSSFCGSDDGGNGSAFISKIQIILHSVLQTAGKGLPVGLGDALGHAVVEVGDGLAAMLVVLVGLNGDGC